MDHKRTKKIIKYYYGEILMKVLRGLLNARSQIDYSSIDGLIELSDLEKKRLQLTLLEMYKDVFAVCKKHDLVPFIAGGSALGAIRHGGFIPWDDDLDFCMTRNDYNHFLKIFNMELSDKYIISAPNYSKKPKARFAKIMKKGTLCREISDISPTSQCGIFIDLFVIENIPDNIAFRYIKGAFCNILEFISGQVYLYEYLTVSHQKLDSSECVRWFIGFCFSFMSSHKWFNMIDKVAQHSNSKSQCCAAVTGRKHYFGEILDRKDLKPVRYIKFCDINVPVFNNLEKYLETLYGNDYMTPPPKSKRERHMVKDLRF